MSQSSDEKVFIQVEPRSPGASMSAQADSGPLREFTTEELGKIGDQIRKFSREIGKQFKRDELTPSEFEVEFGVGVGLEGGLPFIAKGTVETNFKVTATWDWRRAK